MICCFMLLFEVFALALSNLFLYCAVANDYDGNMYFLCFDPIDVYKNLYDFVVALRFS